MNVTVTNNTPFPVLLNGTLFQPGKYGTVPATPILPEQSTTYKLEDSNIGGGINGGNAWLVVLDNPEGDTWSFATCSRDHRKPGLLSRATPKTDDSAATPEGNSIISTGTFQGKDGPSFKFTASTTFDESGTTVFAVGIIVPN